MFFETLSEAIQEANRLTTEEDWSFCVCESLSSQVFNLPIKYVVYMGCEDFSIYCTIVERIN